MDGQFEFYLENFDLLADELLRVVEELRTMGRISRAINAMFITLIPNKSNPSTFNDLRPISLCNLFYKFIAKMIANWVKVILFTCLPEEKFGFHFN